MHIYFSAIGGAGIGPLAQIAQQAGYTVSGSDKQDSQYIQYLRTHGITNIHIGQTREAIAAVHDATPIDWLVYSSAVALEHPESSPELQFCAEQDIKTSKRDELLNQLLLENDLKMVAIAGTHGKTTTTAMTVWLFKQLKAPISYLLPAKTSFGDMGEYTVDSQYFVYEADEFDRNFLAYEPALSVITGVSWDHHEIFPTREEYQQAFRDFINQSQCSLLWQDDAEYLGLEGLDNDIKLFSPDDEALQRLTLKGLYNRHDAWLAMQAVHKITGAKLNELVEHVNRFPGLQRRMEQIAPNLFSDYAHTPEKIRGAMSVAREMADESGQDLVVVYEPLTNRRQHYLKEEYKDCFDGAARLYWIPSYLAREDPAQPVLAPAELISYLSDSSFAVAAERDEMLRTTIQNHLDAGDMVVCMAGGGGNSLDEWLRREFAS